MKKTLLLAGTSHLLMRAAVGRARYGKPMRDEAGHEPPKPAEPAVPPAEPAAPAAGDPPAPEAGAAFNDAFAAALAEGSEPAAPEAKPAEPAAPEAKPAEPAAPPAPTPPAGDPPAPEAKPAEPAAPTADDVVKTLMERLSAPPAPTPAAPTAEPAPTPLYSPEEITTIAEYETNWPDVAKAEGLKRRAEYSDLLKFVFSEVQKFVQPTIESVRSMGNSLHLGEVRTLVPEYTEALESDVNTWIETQPAYLQPAYKHVMQKGTSDEVADLIGRYRTQAGIAPAAAPTPSPAPAAGGKAPAAAAKPAAPKTELSEAAKKAADSLAPVSGDRSQAPAGEDPNDFDSAFKKYATAG